jgi:hypothetical protein
MTPHQGHVRDKLVRLACHRTFNLTWLSAQTKVLSLWLSAMGCTTNRSRASQPKHRDSRSRLEFESWDSGTRIGFWMPIGISHWHGRSYDIDSTRLNNSPNSNTCREEF